MKKHTQILILKISVRPSLQFFPPPAILHVTAIIFLFSPTTLSSLKNGGEKKKRMQLSSSSYPSRIKNKKSVKCNTISHMHVLIHPRSLLYLPSVIFYFLQNGEQKKNKIKIQCGKCVTRNVRCSRLNHFIGSAKSL